MVLLVFSLLLAACGDATVTSQSVNSSTTLATTTIAAVITGTTSAEATTVPASTADPTTPSATTLAAVPTAPGSDISQPPAVAKMVPGASPTVYHPVMSISSASVAAGSSLTVSGEGFPANTKLAIQLGPAGGPIATDSRTTSDASGRFSSKVFFVTHPDGSVVKPGKCALTVMTEDGLVKSGATVSVVEVLSARYSPTKLIQDFFAAFKDDPKSAAAFRGNELQAAIESGSASLPEMLGVQNAPVSVDVTPVAGKPNTYDVYENFQAGKQFIQVDLASDGNGALKIVAIRILKSSQ